MIEPRQKALKELWDMAEAKCHPHLHSFKKRTYTKTSMSFYFGEHYLNRDYYILIKYNWEHKEEIVMTRPRSLRYQNIELLTKEIKAWKN